MSSPDNDFFRSNSFLKDVPLSINVRICAGGAGQLAFLPRPLFSDRVKTLLGKLDSMRRSKERGSPITYEIRRLSNKFIGQVENIFANLPKPLEWRSFFDNDLPLLVDFCEEVQEVSIQHRP